MYLFTRALLKHDRISPFTPTFVGAQPLPPSSLDQTQVWLAVNEDGLSVLDYTMVSVCFRK